MTDHSRQDLPYFTGSGALREQTGAINDARVAPLATICSSGPVPEPASPVAPQPAVWRRPGPGSADGADIKIFGERNTATNALKELIERNSLSRVFPSVAREIDRRFHRKVRLIAKLPCRGVLREMYIDSVFRCNEPRLAWKHTATNFDDVGGFQNCVVLLTTRHPASWLLALYRRPYHRLQALPATFVAFLGTNWKTLRRDNVKRRFVAPIELWNIKMRSYTTFANRLRACGITHRWVRFEDFVRDQRAVFESLRNVLHHPADVVAVIAKSTKEREKDFRYYKEYYDNVRWLSEIDEASRRLINERVDWDVGARFEYHPLDRYAKR